MHNFSDIECAEVFLNQNLHEIFNKMESRGKLKIVETYNQF